MKNWNKEYGYAVLAGAMALAILFGPAIFQGKAFVFRDAAHFYYPAFQYVQSAWAEGWPLWNASEQLGRPLLADPTSCVFYPGSLLFLLPCGFATAYVMLVVAHFGLAMLATFWAARGFGLSPAASLFAALSYALGGHVLGQHANPIYLFGAAWLPLGILFVFRATQFPTRHNILRLAFVHAMVVLGGDIQMACHLIMAQILLILVMWRNKDGFSAQRKSLPALLGRTAKSAVLPLAAALGLTAVQFLPSWEWSSQSNRAHYEKPRNIYELAHAKLAGHQAGAGGLATLAARPARDTHQAKTYDFSIGPWRWAELVWPNALGRQYPVNRRWGNLIPAEGRVWTPTLYAGFLPFVFFLLAFPHCRRTPFLWLKWGAIGAALASLGAYGAGWLANQLAHGLGWDWKMWEPVGGPYWLMNILLPFYAQFRYPAKLWTLFSISMSLLAGYGLDRVADSGGRQLVRSICLLAGLGMAAALLVIWALPAPSGSGLARDSLFGPLDLPAAKLGLLQSAAHVALAGAFFLLLSRYASGWRLRYAAAVLTAVDLCVANSWTIATADQQHWQAPCEIASAIRRHASDHGIRNYRIYRPHGYVWYPDAWARQPSRQRQKECLVWDRETLYPRYALLEGLDSFKVSNSFSAHEFHQLSRSQSKFGIPNGPTRRAFRIAYVVGPAQAVADCPGLVPIHSATLFGESVVVAHDPNCFPRAWAVYQSRPPDSEPGHIVRSLFGGSGDAQRLRQRAIADGGLDEPASAVPADSAISRIDYGANGQLRITASLEQPGLIVTSDQYAPGWKCRATRNSGEQLQVKVIRANGIMRAARLPAGDFDVEFYYDPLSFKLGKWVSFVTLFVGAACCLPARASSRD